MLFRSFLLFLQEWAYYDLGYLVCHIYNVTDFLCICNWFGKYMKISQRIRNKSVVEEIHEKIQKYAHS